MIGGEGGLSFVFVSIVSLLGDQVGMYTKQVYGHFGFLFVIFDIDQ